jgi:DNA-binding transcriptional LysR family regulator
MMELRHARYFVTTADAGSVSAAAARLHVAQPSLSRQLRQLESELGVELFVRAGGQRLTLSPAGRDLLPQARTVLAEAKRLVDAAGYHASGGLRRLSVGAPTVTLTDVVAPFVATLGQDDPDVDVLPSDGLSPEEATERGADLVITTHAPGRAFVTAPLAVLPVWGYVAADHPWADRDTVAVEELGTTRVIVLPPTATAREALDVALASRGIGLGSALEAANGTLAQALAAAGRGMAVVSDDPRFGLRRAALVDGRAALSIRLLAAWDPRHPGAPTIAATADRLREFVTQRYGAPAS